MSNTVRNGFSTLNRLLGKKNKDTSMSKSVSNLSTLDSSSQHNKIIPLAASNNAPFEQTFRITICLPRDQLYVVRVGAKTKLTQLLETVCVSKQLDRDKFEFRHPDGTQTYDNDMTIGEVGLNEIRLADKNDKTYIKFNTDELMKLRHLSRESLTSSSEFSKGSNKHSVYSKTISPYSSTNSLNSMDSATGMNPNHHNYSHHHNNRNSLHHPPVAPQRKKRVAPRPPSQNSINENHVVETVINSSDALKKPLAVPRKSFHASTPNLNGNHNGESNAPLNNNNSNIVNKNIEEEHSNKGDVKIRNGSFTGSRPPRPSTQSYASINVNDAENRNQLQSGSLSQWNHSRTSSESSELPTPKKRSIVATSRKKAPPAPPPRLVIPVSPTATAIDTTTSVEEVSTPTIVPTPNSTTPPSNPNISKVMLNVEPPIPSIVETLPQSAPRVIDIDSRDLPSTTPSSPANITDEPRSLESKSDISSDEDETKIYNIQTGKPVTIQEPTVSKPKLVQSTMVAEVSSTETSKESAPVRVVVETPTSPVVNKSLTVIQNTSEPSSRAESPLWTYTLPAPPKFADSELDPSNHTQTITTTGRTELFNGESLIGSSDTATVVSDLSDLSDVPIKPIIKERLPLDFQVFNDASTIGEDIQSVTASDVEDGYQGFSQRFSREALLESLERRREQFIESEFKFLTTEETSLTSIDATESCTKSPMQDVTDKIISNQTFKDDNRKVSIESEVINELKEVITNPKLDSIAKNGNDAIVGCDPNALSNFSINIYASDKPAVTTTNGNNYISKDVENHKPSVNPTKEAEDVVDVPAELGTGSSHIKRPSLTNGSFVLSRINRSDSFHSTRPIDPTADASTIHQNGFTPRSSSYISLIGTQKFENRSLRSQYSDSTMRRNSSSELSIADSPSLQSLSVMKTILSNSRKNSLNNDGNMVCSTDIVEDVIKPEQTVLKNTNTSVTDINMPTKSVLNETHPKADQTKTSEQEVAPVKAQINVTVTQLNADPAPSNIPEKKWRYQGPPSISMSTWGERPKSTVFIKTDNDYKSNKTDSTPQTVFKNVTNNLTPQVTTPKKNVLIHSQSAVEHDRTPIIRGVVPKAVVQPQLDSLPTEPSNILIRRPSYEISTYIVDKPLSEATVASSTMTLGRVSTPNRWSTYGSSASNPATVPSSNMAAASAVTVKTFKVSDPVNNHTSSTMLNAPNKNNKNYAIAKDGSFDSGYKSMPPVYSELTAAKLAQAETEPVAAAPFSQFSLRKTGLKDKILADPTARNITKPTAESVVQNQTTVQLRSLNGNGQHLQRAFSVPTFIAPPAFVKPQVDVTVKKVVPPSPVGTTSVSIPPPPPSAAGLAPPFVRSVTTKKVLPPVEVDPRDQLMDAIRNFGKNGGLKKK